MIHCVRSVAPLSKCLQFRLSVTGAETDKHREIKEAVRSKGIKAIADVIAQFNTDLRERSFTVRCLPLFSYRTHAAGAGIAEPNKQPRTDQANGSSTSSTTAPAAVKSESTPIEVETVQTAAGGTVKTTKLKLTHKFACRYALLHALCHCRSTRCIDRATWSIV